MQEADHLHAANTLRASYSRVVPYPLPDRRFGVAPVTGTSPALHPTGTEEQDKKATHGRPSEVNTDRARPLPSPGDFKPDQLRIMPKSMGVHPTTAAPPVPFVPRPRPLDRLPTLGTSLDHLKKGNGRMLTMTGRTVAMLPPMEAGCPRLTILYLGMKELG